MLESACHHSGERAGCGQAQIHENPIQVNFKAVPYGLLGHKSVLVCNTAMQRWHPVTCVEKGACGLVLCFHTSQKPWNSGGSWMEQRQVQDVGKAGASQDLGHELDLFEGPALSLSRSFPEARELVAGMCSGPFGASQTPLFDKQIVSGNVCAVGDPLEWWMFHLVLAEPRKKLPPVP